MLFVDTPLYWLSQLCESVARLADVRREHSVDMSRRRPRMTSSCPRVTHTWRKRQPDDSLKRNFLAKVVEPIADYAREYELAQFVFKLSVWTSAGRRELCAEGPRGRS